MKIEAIKIINPDTQEPVAVEDWRRQENPARAEWVLIETDELRPFCLHKYLLAGGRFMTFGEALDEGNMLTIDQAVAVYVARFHGLKEAMDLIGGIGLRLNIWTCERDRGLCFAPVAHTASLRTGTCDYIKMTDYYQALCVTPYPIEI